jgi:mono/diheme cytochrome c family protein
LFFSGYLKQADKSLTAPGEPDGSKLYVQNCANCHGVRGDGNGTTLLTPRARYFGKDKFKFASSSGNIPTQDDLTRLIRRGIPGSAMPAFPQLTDDQVRAIIEHVRVLARNGRYERMLEKAEKDAKENGDEFDRGELRRKADAQFASEAAVPPLEVPARFAPSSPESVVRGRQVFIREACVKCHGPEGRGDGEQVSDPKFRNDDGSPAKPRDLTIGLFKGGAGKEHLYARVMLGIPGTPMPAASSTLKPADIDDLLNYVLSLSPPQVAVGPTTTPAVVPPR